ncbi:VOC family protein [Asticcacaulis tiandongensis]|uniref:VOC family protein n=1 Tax=Asticcacaulis tiandongensis TaxID=2565365 RepID=UPI001126AC09|nr:VOC family protein [Asticcacaulis tiandongensis]
MTARHLDHINIQTHDMAGTIAFYAEFLGLEARTAPQRDPSERQWLYVGERAVIHLNLFGTDNTIPRDVIPGDPTGAIHHVAFECDGYDDTIAKIEARGLHYACNDIPAIGLRQLFVNDPNNVLLELNFRSPRP